MPDSSDRALISSFLRASLSKREAVGFEPWLITYEFSILRQITKRLVETIEERFDIAGITGICALARSGIPLGVLLSLSLKKPLHFWFRESLHFEDKKGLCHLVPPMEHNGRYLLVDSHAVTLHTATSALKFLHRKYNATVEGLVTLFSFSDRFDSGEGKFFGNEQEGKIPIITLGWSKEYNALLTQSMGSDDNELLWKTLKDHPGRHKYYPDSPYIPPRIHRTIDLLQGVLKKFVNHGEISRLPQEIDRNFSKRLRKEVGSRESEIWSLFSNPTIMQEISKIVKTNFSLREIEAIFAIGLVGTIFGLIIAHSEDFKGSFFTTYKPVLWNEAIKEKNITEAMITIGRLRTGMYLRGTYDSLIKKYRVAPQKIIVLRYTPEGVDFPRNRFLYYYLQGLENKLNILS